MYSLVGVLIFFKVKKDLSDGVMYELVGLRLLLKFVLFIYEMV